MALTQGSPLPNITTTQGQTTSAPSWYTDYLSDLSKNVTAQTTGPDAAKYVGAQPLQNQAFTAAGALPGKYDATLQSGIDLTQQVGSTDVAKRAGEFMNPYTTQVVDALGQLGQRNIQQFLAPQATSAAVGSGQFGSKRGAEALGSAINTGLQNINATQAQALQTGYSQALQAAQADQQRQLESGRQMGALAQQGQGMDLADINALATMGGQQQTIAQNEELFPLQSLNQGAQALRGYSIPTSVNSTYTGPIPGAYASSPLQQIAGLGAVVAGASGTDFGKYLGSKISGWLNGPSSGGNPGGGTSGGSTIVTNPDDPNFVGPSLPPNNDSSSYYDSLYTNNDSSGYFTSPNNDSSGYYTSPNNDSSGYYDSVNNDSSSYY
jgi:hypothetical protein